jgi:hypothetical protein
VAGSCKHCDEPSDSGTTELVSVGAEDSNVNQDHGCNVILAIVVSQPVPLLLQCSNSDRTPCVLPSP